MSSRLHHLVLQHGKSVKRTFSSARSVAVEVLVLFLKIMSKSVTIRNPFPASSASQEGSVGEVSVQVDLYFLHYYQNCFSYHHYHYIIRWTCAIFLDYHYYHNCCCCYYHYHYIINRWTCTHTRELASTKSPWKVIILMLLAMTHKPKVLIHRRHQLIRTNHFHLKSNGHCRWRTQHCVNIVTGLPSLSLTTP